MSIDPKKGGKCWSCKYCEDIATQDNNPSGSYYRKCTNSGKEYIDTCSFTCGSYVWDEKTPENSYTSSASSSPSVSSSSSEEKEGCFGKLWGCFLTLLIIGVINAAVGGAIWLIFRLVAG